MNSEELLERLRQRAKGLPDPFRARALANVKDAARDLALWPEWSREILRDCREAVLLHEGDAGKSAT